MYNFTMFFGLNVMKTHKCRLHIALKKAHIYLDNDRLYDALVLPQVRI